MLAVLVGCAHPDAEKGASGRATPHGVRDEVLPIHRARGATPRRFEGCCIRQVARQTGSCEVATSVYRIRRGGSASSVARAHARPQRGQSAVSGRIHLVAGTLAANRDMVETPIGVVVGTDPDAARAAVRRTTAFYTCKLAGTG